MKVTAIAQLVNELGDYREVEVELGHRHRWKPRLILMTPFEQLIAEAHEDAERIANERPPDGWPADRPTGTWVVVNFFTRDSATALQPEGARRRGAIALTEARRR